MTRLTVIVAAMLLLLSGMVRAELGWDAALAGEHRSEQNKARDFYRHPRETLSFFGLEAGMTVMEVSPGGGWYTEVLGPLMKGNGKLLKQACVANALAERTLASGPRKYVPDVCPPFRC